MSYIYPQNLPENHPLNFKYIQRLQKNFLTLDPFDICFPYLYKIPEILCSNDKKRYNCHSITALKNYSFLSFEEMRNLNYSKRNFKSNLQDEKYINNIIKSKQQYFQGIFSNAQNKMYFYELLTDEEKRQIIEYLNQCKLGIENSSECLANNYNHINFNLQQLVENENKKEINKGILNSSTFLNNNYNSNNNLIGNINNNNLTSLNKLNNNNLFNNLNNNNLFNNLNNNSFISNSFNRLNPNFADNSFNKNLLSNNNILTSNINNNMNNSAFGNLQRINSINFSLNLKFKFVIKYKHHQKYQNTIL